MHEKSVFKCIPEDFLSNRAAGARKFWIFWSTQNQDSDNCDCFAPQAPKNEVKTSLRWQYYDNRAITRSQTMSLAPPYLVASGGPKGGGQTQGTPLIVCAFLSFALVLSKNI